VTGSPYHVVRIFLSHLLILIYLYI
jgi:hypothetical protein